MISRIFGNYKFDLSMTYRTINILICYKLKLIAHLVLIFVLPFQYILDCNFDVPTYLIIAGIVIVLFKIVWIIVFRLKMNAWNDMPYER